MQTPEQLQRHQQRLLLQRQRYLEQVFLMAVDKLLEDESTFYRATTAYTRLDLLNPRHVQLLTAVRADAATLRSAKLSLDRYKQSHPGLAGGPLRSAPFRRREAWGVPFRMPTTTPTFRPAPRDVSRLPAPAPRPGALSARERQEAAIQRQRDIQIEDFIGSANRLAGMLIELNRIGQGGEPMMRGGLTSADWIDGLQMKGEDPRVWRSSYGPVLRGNREHYMRLLLRNIRTQSRAVEVQGRFLRTALHRSPALSDVVQSDSSPAIWFVLALGAAYLLYEGAVSAS